MSNELFKLTSITIEEVLEEASDACSGCGSMEPEPE